jgi:hypothetical protein
MLQAKKVAGSSPDEVIEFFFYLSNPSNPIMAMGFTQPLTEITTEAEK